MQPVTRRLLIVLLLVLGIAKNASATHIYGADFFYTYVSGTTYTVTLVIYGDCQARSNPNNVFGSLSTAAPEVIVYRNGTYKQTTNLSIQSPSAGVEVTPVCPAQLSNTACVSTSTTIPGVKKFTYSGNITLNDTATNWLFEFTGNLNTSSAGRSSTITNINNPGSSTIRLDATLNNIDIVNSSPVYTTIPTPFFCINKAANFNPGTVDPNTDSLVYSLVPGYNSASGSTVSYKTGYSATAPLATSTGTFSFSSTTGQLSFTPNLVQRSLVVYKVSEYRNGKLVGTSMREMTFVVLNNCNNNAPTGNISSNNIGTIANNTTINVCQSSGTLTFNINPTDADSNVINVSAAGVPAGATFNISNNNTTAPSTAFSWNVTTVTPGAYTFFLTYTDDGCPLTAKQTIAYTVNVLQNPTVTYNIISAATCTKKAVFTVSPGISGPWKVKFYQGASVIDSASTASTTLTDSLAPGSYTIRIFNSNNCYKDTSITLASPANTHVAASVQSPTCNHFANGVVTVVGSNSTSPYTYSINAGAYGTSNTFSNLASGACVLHVKDAAGCTKDTSITLMDSLKVTETLSLSNVKCAGDSSGSIQISPSGGSSAGYAFSINSGTATSSSIITGLKANTYTIYTTDGIGCYMDTTVYISEPQALVAHHSFSDVSCFNGLNGIIIENAAGGVSPYLFQLNNGSLTSSDSFGGLKAASYLITVKDANGCTKTDAVTISQPSAIVINSLAVTNAKCNGDANGAITVNVFGGVGSYTYGTSFPTSATSNILNGLAAGNYNVFITDANGCEKDTFAKVGQPTRIVPSLAIKQPVCKTLANGKVVISATGGYPSYTYSLNDQSFSTKNTYSPLAAGTYLVHVRDDSSCVVDTSFTLTDSLYVSAYFNITNPLCYGMNNGYIDVMPVGGLSPYKIAVKDSIYTDSTHFSSFAAGNYIVHVKDTLGCINDTTVTIGQPDSLSLTANLTYNNCYGLDTVGKVEVIASGGTEPYSYAWSTDTASKANMISNLRNGDYKVRVTDANGCQDSLIATIIYNDCCTPFMPNAFTPNGDGKNDLFRIRVKGDMKLETFVIYNRFGECVFSTNSIDAGWDGTYKGQVMDVGVYYYYLKAICGNGGERKIEMKGDVTLIR